MGVRGGEISSQDLVTGHHPPVGKGAGDCLGERKHLRPTLQIRVEMGAECGPSQDNRENAGQGLSLLLPAQ